VLVDLYHMEESTCGRMCLPSLRDLSPSFGNNDGVKHCIGNGQSNLIEQTSSVDICDT
jgi:hypothetical protein